ncbi:helix-turn-helix domain-containing protein [Paenibacillus macerans]|uniref:helix-turn-helix domain-containing protein n=1 Tax=Paenibacillus macerans TaxID=44252 RepID=UPI00203CF3F6|nr:helix-turn-helix domain-containing protein [Paenibacillus macerans]MCM3703993.1 helix-turn-helix domain-containing protein [Paenibacillus macerans]
MMYTTKDFPDLTYLCKQLHESLQLPVYFQPNADFEEEIILNACLSPHPFFADPAELFRSVVSQETDLYGPLLRETNFMEQFIVLPVKQHGHGQAFIVIGPAIRQKLNDEICANLLNDYGLLNPERTRWTEYWNSLPVMNRLRMLHIGVLTNWMINREALDITDVLQSSLQYGLPNRQKEKVELALAERREFSIFHEGIERANRMLALIRNGNKTDLMRKLAEATYDETEVLSNRSHLRSVKNLAISGVSISMLAAIEGGLYEELAFTLCNMQIQHIEELNEVKTVEAAAIQAMLDFADRVAQCRKNSVSKPVYICKEYIYSHLFEEIRLQELAELSGLNPEYLSQLFKKETGLTLMNYIQWERIEEAKKLLAHSGEPISTIGARLTFYDQSHFIKVFKKHTGVTPKQYRNRVRTD